jgi:hypothetical protein
MPSIRYLLALFSLILLTNLHATLAAAAAAAPLADCYYSSRKPFQPFLLTISKSNAINCLSKLRSASTPFSKLPTAANCHDRNWSMQSPTAGHVGDVPNKKCVDLCLGCLKTAIGEGYKNAQCDVMVEGVFGPVCQIFMGEEI